MQTLIRIAESGYLPDALVRVGIRRLLRRRLAEQRRRADGGGSTGPTVEGRQQPIAVSPQRANEQHYELPAEFFELLLGPHLKYSSAHWSSPEQTLEQAEEEMLELTCARAGIEDGMGVLDLGCGWGSLSLWIARRFPRCRVTAVSNSGSQGRFIRRCAIRRGLSNVTVVTEDVNRFDSVERFDRIVSVEMFEHVRNHGALLRRIARWLDDAGRLFVHVFCHRRFSYPFEIEGDEDWMARHFFTGGMMPSLHLLERFDEDLAVTRTWIVKGTHYRRTLLAWLRNLDRRPREVLHVLEGHYGRRDARLWFVRWRLFLLGCAELFGYRGGEEWMVAHHLLERPAR